jgi:aspartyl protease family protein
MLDPADQARLFYLALLGLAALVGVFARYRGRLAQGVQHAAIWGLIFAGIVIAYGFRGQLAEGLFGAPPEIVTATSVALARGADGHFHATAEVNGRAVRFLVDTGATLVVLSRRDAERAGIDPDRLLYVHPAETANGRVMNAAVTLERLRLGPFEDRDVPAMVAGGELGVSLLGMSWLSRLARLRVEGDRMVLER